MRGNPKGKPVLKLASSTDTGSSSANDPPRPLGQHGAALWQAIVSSYDVRDEAGRELLCGACQALDRAEALREQIDRDGEILRTKTGLRDHPGLKHEVACRSLVTRSLARLGLEFEPVRASVGRPPGVY